MLKLCKILVLFIGIQGVTLNLSSEPTQRFWTTWNGTQECQIETLFAPTTQEEIIFLIQKAYALGKKVKVIGAGHSPNAIALPEKEGWTLSLENYAKILEVDLVHQTITVQGGATLKQINEVLDQHGLSLENLGSISDQTIGGVIQTGTHGTGKNYGPLHTQVLAMTVVNGKGELKSVTPTLSPLFQAYQCGLGTLGVIDTVTLRAVPARFLCKQAYPAKWPDLLDQIEDLVQNNEHFCFYWFPYTNCVGVWTANSQAEKVCKFPMKQGVSPLFCLIEEIAKERNDRTICSIEDVLELGPTDPTIMKRFNRAFFEVGYGKISEWVDRSDRILNVDCGAHSHCYAIETAFPMLYTKPFLLELQELVEKNHFPAHTGVEVRFVRADQALISPTSSGHPEDLFCLVSIVSIRPNLYPTPYEAYFQAFQELTEKYQGRLHWGKMGKFDPSYLRQAYPHWEKFRELQREEDPSGMFLNEFTGKILERLPVEINPS